MAVSNDIPWLGFLTADIRGAQAPDAPVCSAAGREGDADKTGPSAIPATCSTYLWLVGNSSLSHKPTSLLSIPAPLSLWLHPVLFSCCLSPLLTQVDNAVTASAVPVQAGASVCPMASHIHPGRSSG